MEENKKIALERYFKGEQYNVSTFIDEDTIIMGYGELDYDFEYPLPKGIIINEYGTTSWREWFDMKGYHQYLTINNKTKEKAITPYLNDNEYKILFQENPNFTITKI